MKTSLLVDGYLKGTKVESNMGWDILKIVQPRLKIKSEMAEFVKGLKSNGKIDDDTFEELFDFTLESLDRMYEVGKKSKR